MMPSARRSSDEKAILCAMAWRGDESLAGTPSISKLPTSAWSAPQSRRTSSVRPDPSNPAMPTTSPS